MEGDLKLLETLLDRLPLHLINQYVSKNRQKREEQRKQKFQKHLKPEWQLKEFTKEHIQIVNDHRVFGFDTDFELFYCRIRSNGEQSELFFRRDNKNNKKFRCSLIRESKTDLTPLLFEWIKVSDKVKTLLMDKKQVVFADIEKTTYGQIYLYNKRVWSDAPLWYIRREAYTCLAIHKLRSDSLIARLPKDVLRLILEKLWE